MMLFESYLKILADIEQDKGATYAREEDPFHNYTRAGDLFNMPATWPMAIRIQEKLTRVALALERGQRPDADDLMDIAIISIKIDQWFTQDK